VLWQHILHYKSICHAPTMLECTFELRDLLIEQQPVAIPGSPLCAYGTIVVR